MNFVVIALYVAAFVGTLVHASVGKVPLWVPVLFACIAGVLDHLPR